IKKLIKVKNFGRCMIFILFVWQIVELTSDYLKFETVLKMEFKIHRKREFPAVTVCVDNEEFENYNLSVHHTSNVGEFIFLSTEKQIILTLLFRYSNLIERQETITFLSIWDNFTDKLIMSETSYSRKCFTIYSLLISDSRKLPMVENPS